MSDNTAKPERDPAAGSRSDAEADAVVFRETAGRLRAEVAKLIVGHVAALDDLVAALFAGGHVLVEGVPGIGKTRLVQTVARALSLGFRRIQFTPDLMPGDITGSEVLASGGEGRTFSFEPGPVFAQIVLADEINRATPKTQAALLEAMQERTVTVGGETHALPEPFFVLATQNPIEMAGTYPLPEAQLDRFMLKLKLGVPSENELVEILVRTAEATEPEVAPVASAEDVLRMQRLAREVPVSTGVRRYASRLVLATHPDDGAREEVRPLRRQPPRSAGPGPVRQGVCAARRPRTRRLL